MTTDYAHIRGIASNPGDYRKKTGEKNRNRGISGNSGEFRGISGNFRFFRNTQNVQPHRFFCEDSLRNPWECPGLA
eukprot:9334243-Lingulodinium_polyedra.AAC.1